MIEAPPLPKSHLDDQETRRSDLQRIAVVIPAYKVKAHVLDVIRKMPPEVSRIIIVDDACPESSGDFIVENNTDSRVTVLKNAKNQGVGGAMITGYKHALETDATIVVKVDGDGQMDPEFIPYLIKPILDNRADYAKGNRFFRLESVQSMPPMRIFGNTVLSFMAKLSTGYWNIFDPTNGYTAIHTKVLAELPLDKVSKRYFFETDMLFRLNTLRAVVVDVPMRAKYLSEISNLQINQVIPEFLAKHTLNLLKRLFYNYWLRSFSIFTVELCVGLLMVAGGSIFGTTMWYKYASQNVPAPTGIIMFAALPIIVGIQFILSFLSWDAHNVPTDPIQRRL